MRHAGIYWIFQIINTLSGAGLFFFPQAAHESLFENHTHAYAVLGFSDTALAMLHNVLRGQGAALLAVSLFLFTLGSRSRHAFSLIAFVCVLSLAAHLATLHQHLGSGTVQQAISGFGALYGMIAVNALLGLGAIWAYRGRAD